MPFFAFIQNEEEYNFDKERTVAKIIIVEAENYSSAEHYVAYVGSELKPGCRCLSCFKYLKWIPENSVGTEKPMFRGKFAVPIHETPQKPGDPLSRAFVITRNDQDFWAEIRDKNG